MTEYGHGVAEGAGTFSGSNGGGSVGGGGDWGAAVGNAVGDAVNTITALPAEQLLLLVIGIVVGLWVLKRAL
jgi:hypothetical protein